MPKRANNSGMGDPEKAEVHAYTYGWLMLPYGSPNTIFYKNVYPSRPSLYAWRDIRWKLGTPDKQVTCPVRKMWIDQAVEAHMKRKGEQLKADLAEHLKRLPVPEELPKIGCVGRDCEYCKELHKTAAAAPRLGTSSLTGSTHMGNTSIKGYPYKTIYMPEQMWRKWDGALRSGDYAQGRGTLCRINSRPEGAKAYYCCLGVLEKVVSGEVEESKMPSPRWLNEHGIVFTDECFRLHINPGNYGKCDPNNLVVDAYLPTLDKTTSLANDGNFAGSPVYTFVEIADAIKQCVFFTDSQASPFDTEAGL